LFGYARFLILIDFDFNSRGVCLRSLGAGAEAFSEKLPLLRSYLVKIGEGT